MTEPIHGVVVIDKPVGPTSFDIVRQARRATGARKVGHGGTLDPLASGVLPICFGEATKLAQFLLDADKEYEATIRFGAETDTGDVGGVVTARYPTDRLGADAVRQALEGFLGEQQQVPPMYSALKRAGRPLYEYARAGQTVDRPSRTIHVHALELRAFGPGLAVASTALDGFMPEETSGPEARIFLRCSKGTYVRSLAYDLGRALGTGAHLSALRRTRSGPFGLHNAIGPDTLALPSLPIVSLVDALAHLSSISISEDQERTLVHGQRISWEQVGAPAMGLDEEGRLVRFLSPTGALVAVARRVPADELIRTLRVFLGPLGASEGHES